VSRELTQEALALEAKLSRNMIIGIEWGRKSIAYERLWDIAEVLDVDVVDLLSPGIAKVTLSQARSRGWRMKPFLGTSRSMGVRTAPARTLLSARGSGRR
jgi:transcriptional regulator with XRE-family HTH domain